MATWSNRYCNRCKGEKREEEENYRTLVSEFVHAHLSWAGDFCKKASHHATTEFYKGYVELLHATVAEAGSDDFLHKAVSHISITDDKPL